MYSSITNDTSLVQRPFLVVCLSFSKDVTSSCDRPSCGGEENLVFWIELYRTDIGNQGGRCEWPLYAGPHLSCMDSLCSSQCISTAAFRCRQ